MRTCTAIEGIVFGILFLPLLSFTQNSDIPFEKKIRAHHELPDQPWLPGSSGATTPAYRYAGSNITTVQVNVNSGGENIVGDAANEPSLAIDPVNPMHMVIGWRQFDNVSSNFRQAGWAYTTDGGQNWTFPGVIQPGIFRSDPVLDIDAAGTFYYNSLTSNAGLYTCRVFKSDNGGATWDNGTEAHGGDKQWMVIDRSGSEGNNNIYSNWTMWYSSCIPAHFTRSVDKGNSYEDCTIIDGNPYWGTMAVGNDGELYITGSSSWGSLIVARSTDAKFSFLTPSWNISVVDLDGFLASGISVNPAGLLGQMYIDVDLSNGPGRGNVYVLASVMRYSNPDSADVMFIRSTDGGVNWSQPVRINDDISTTNYQWLGTMSVAPNGRIDAVWLDTRDSPAGGPVLSALYYSYSLDQGVTWSANEMMSDLFDSHVGWPMQAKMGDYFQMRSDENGANLAWANTLNGEEDVYYSYITPETNISGTGEGHAPVRFTVYPNPVRANAIIRYLLPAAGKMKLTLCNVYGETVMTFTEGIQQAGIHTVSVPADELPAGCYICRLAAGSFTGTARLVKVK